MRIERETKVVNKYISDDGRTFESEEECLKWENHITYLKKKMDEIPRIVVAESGSMGLPDTSDENILWVVKPRDKKDIEIINAYCNEVYNSFLNLEEADIRKSVAIRFGYDEMYIEVYVLDDILYTIHELYHNVDKRLNAMITEEKKESEH